MPPKTTSFDRVIGIVLPRMGWNLTRLAAELGITKQALTNFRNRGRFPTSYLSEISRLTKIPIAEFQPIISDEIADLSRKWRLSIADTETRLICLGIDNANRK